VYAGFVDELARFFALEQRLLERLGTRVEPFEYGVAFFDEDFRARYNSTSCSSIGGLMMFLPNRSSGQPTGSLVAPGTSTGRWTCARIAA
jgi:hypothetical protein